MCGVCLHVCVGVSMCGTYACVYMGVCVCVLVEGRCRWPSQYKRKLNFSETEVAFLRDKIVLIHLWGLIIMAGSGFICKLCCHLSD